MKINASIVLYNSNPSLIEDIAKTLFMVKNFNHLYLIDNSKSDSLKFLSKKSKQIIYIFNNKNVGYGAGHNIAIKQTQKNDINYHIVINPDIEVSNNTINILFSYMEENKSTGLAMPKILNTDGSIQYLCKKIPTPFDLFLRFFTPKRFMKDKKNDFILAESGYNQIMNVPYLSGCFMFLNMKAIKDIGLFDERFFMYPEDIDLTRRIHMKYKTLFLPTVSVVHHHEKASHKSIKMALIHIYNLVKYFNKWGWIFDSERKKINSNINY